MKRRAPCGRRKHMLGRAILYTIVTALLAADQVWMGFGTSVPQLVVGGVNILVVIAAFLQALNTNPFTKKLGGRWFGLGQDMSNGIGAGSKPAPLPPPPGGGSSGLSGPVHRRLPNGRRGFRHVPPVAILCLAFGLTGATQSGCTPAQVAETTQIETTIINDIKAGDTDQQIELDVAAIVIPAGQPLVVTDTIVAIVNDVLDELINLNVIPPVLLPSAVAMHARLTTQLASKGVVK
jgi:hypothetical protein